jgi:hypothetical protein
MPTGPSVRHARGWARPVPTGALCQLRGGDGESASRPLMSFGD